MKVFLMSRRDPGESLCSRKATDSVRRENLGGGGGGGVAVLGVAVVGVAVVVVVVVVVVT